MPSIESQSGIDRTQADQEAELIALRARVAELERQLVEVEAWANRSLGAAQERLYWLDRWQLDLNAVMERPVAGRVRTVLRFGRSAYRLLRKAKRLLQRT